LNWRCLALVCRVKRARLRAPFVVARRIDAHCRATALRAGVPTASLDCTFEKKEKRKKKEKEKATSEHQYVVHFLCGQKPATTCASAAGIFNAEAR